MRALRLSPRRYARVKGKVKKYVDEGDHGCVGMAVGSQVPETGLVGPVEGRLEYRVFLDLKGEEGWVEIALHFGDFEGWVDAEWVLGGRNGWGDAVRPARSILRGGKVRNTVRREGETGGVPYAICCS